MCWTELKFGETAAVNVFLHYVRKHCCVQKLFMYLDEWHTGYQNNQIEGSKANGEMQLL